MVEKNFYVCVVDSGFSEKFYLCWGNKIAKDLGFSKLPQVKDTTNFQVSKDDIFEIIIDSFLLKLIKSKNFWIPPGGLFEFKTGFLIYLQSKNFQFPLEYIDISKIKIELVNYIKLQKFETRTIYNIGKTDKKIDLFYLITGGLVFWLALVIQKTQAFRFIKEHVLPPNVPSTVTVVDPSFYSPERAVREGTEVCTPFVFEELNKYYSENQKIISYHQRRFLINQVVTDFLAETYFKIEDSVVDRISEEIDERVQRAEVSFKSQVPQKTANLTTSIIARQMGQVNKQQQNAYKVSKPIHPFQLERIIQTRHAQSSLTSSPPSKSFAPGLSLDSSTRKMMELQAIDSEPNMDVTKICRDPSNYVFALITPSGLTICNVGKAGGYIKIPGDNFSTGPKRMDSHLGLLRRNQHWNSLLQFTYNYYRPYFEQNPGAVRQGIIRLYTPGTSESEVLEGEKQFIHECAQHGTINGRKFFGQYGETKTLCANSQDLPDGYRFLTERRLEFLFNKPQAYIDSLTQEQVSNYMKR